MINIAIKGVPQSRRCRGPSKTMLTAYNNNS